MKTILTMESAGLDTSTATGSRLRIKLIDAGEGSSGTYTPELLKQAAKDKVFAKGTHMYADHPGAQESWDRPERTIRDLAAVLESDAEYVAAETALYADTKVFPNWRETLLEMKDSIGVSIRASAEVADGQGTDGKPLITRLVEAQSVDFVTKAGRGGKIAEVLESARAANHAVARHGVAEATANQLREWLRAAVSAAYPNIQDEGSFRYAWVKDFDDSTVWYEVESSDGYKLYQQSYTPGDGSAALDGDPTEVRVEISYVPISTPADAAESAPTDSPSIPAGVTENRKGSTVTTTTIEESALADLRAQASRASVLEADNLALRQTTAEAIVAEAFTGIEAPRTTARIIEAFTAPGATMTPDELRTEATESAAEWKAANGAGQVEGLGNTTSTATAQEAAEPSNGAIVSALKGL